MMCIIGWMKLKKARKLYLDKLYPGDTPLRILQFPVGSQRVPYYPKQSQNLYSNLEEKSFNHRRSHKGLKKKHPCKMLQKILQDFYRDLKDCAGTSQESFQTLDKKMNNLCKMCKIFEDPYEDPETSSTIFIKYHNAEF